MSQPTARQAPADVPPSARNGAEAVVSGSVPAARDADPMIGRVLDGRFTIEAKLGAGSMGTVYRAKQHAMGRNVAIKILRSDRALDESSRARFLREARANSLLASAHTVTVFDFGQADNGDFFLAMELLEGESLGQRLQREKRLGPEAAVDVARQALRSLAEAHAKGIIHRDLKPDNLFFARALTTDESGRTKHEEMVKVVDFGIAKMLTDDNSPMNAIETQAGTVFGTPRYMSPEQAQGKPLDARSDLYSLGVILYHMLTGRPPFTDDDAIVVMARHIKTPPKRPIEAAPQANIPGTLDDVVMRILAKEPHQRPGSAEAMSQELARAMSLTATTSGVRPSIPGSNPPPATGAAVPQIPPPPAVPKVAIPAAPLSDGSLSVLPSSTESLQIAAGVATSRRKTKTVIGVAGAVLALAAVAAIVFGTRAAPSVRAPVVTRDVPAAHDPLIPPVPADTSVATAAAPPATGRPIPETNVTDLPRAPRAGAPTPPPPRARPPSKPSPQPSATGTGHYGLFE